MVTYNDLIEKNDKISIVGLGYVGLPIAIAFAKKVGVIGFDINSEKVNLYKEGVDPTNEVGSEAVKNTTIEFTSNPADLKKAKFHIVAVPTPVNRDKTPNLMPLKSACKIVGQNMVKGSIIVFESTVYPGVTEDVCIPILEEASNLKCSKDFKVGFSPERINPGDKIHRLENIVKVVSGCDKESLEVIAETYELVVQAGVYKATTIKVAEAAKIIENSQRDINIAFMNELSLIFHKLKIDTLDVLEAAGTKWNFLNFRPGLVGGHCIGVDPYYLTYKAEEVGYHSQVILSGRKINDGMGQYVAQNTVKELIKTTNNIKDSNIAILGLTFKEDCPDIRNTKVIDIINELSEYGITPDIVDPVADVCDSKTEYGITLTDMSDVNNLDCIIVAVAHKEFLNLSIETLIKKDAVIIDVKGILNKEELIKNGYRYWRL